MWACVGVCAKICDFMPSEEAGEQVCVFVSDGKEKVSIWDSLFVCAR